MLAFDDHELSCYCTQFPSVGDIVRTSDTGAITARLQNIDFQSNRMFFWWELCKPLPQHWYLIDSLSRASWNPREQVAIAFAPFSNIIWRAVCESRFLLWFTMGNIHYNRTTTLEEREKIIALWTSGSEQAQIAEEVGLSPQTVSNIVNKFL